MTPASRKDRLTHGAWHLACDSGRLWLLLFIALRVFSPLSAFPVPLRRVTEGSVLRDGHRVEEQRPLPLLPPTHPRPCTPTYGQTLTAEWALWGADTQSSLRFK